MSQEGSQKGSVWDSTASHPSPQGSKGCIPFVVMYFWFLRHAAQVCAVSKACTLTNLLPDRVYDVRIQLACAWQKWALTGLEHKTREVRGSAAGKDLVHTVLPWSVRGSPGSGGLEGRDTPFEEEQVDFVSFTMFPIDLQM